MRHGRRRRSGARSRPLPLDRDGILLLGSQRKPVRPTGKCQLTWSQWRGWKSNTYFVQIRTQWLLAQDVQSLLNGLDGLARVDVRARGDPHRFQTRVIQHVVVAGVGGDVEVVVVAV